MTLSIRRFVSNFRLAGVQAFKRYRNTPHIVKNWRVWAIRRALLPYFSINCWVTSRCGSKFFLGNDPIDDMILEGVLKNHVTLYFPDVLSNSAYKGLILDVGAHHGFYAVETLRRYPRTSLIAIEPNPRAINLLKKNLAANKLLHRVEVVQAAIGDHDGLTFLNYSGAGSWGDTIFSDGDHMQKSVRVPLRRVSTILKDRKPNIVKCNAEGAEFEFFPQLFSMGVHPEFVILMAHPEYGSVDELLELFRFNGYHIGDAGTTQKRIRLHCMLNLEERKTCD